MKRCVWFGQSKIEYEWTPKRVKNLNLRVKPNGEVVASSPFFVSADEMDRFVLLHGEYILAAKSCIEEKLRLQKERANEEEKRVWILGEPYTLQVRLAAQNSFCFGDKELILHLTDLENESLRTRILDACLNEICREYTRSFCQKWYPAFAEACPSFPELSFRKMRSRWGSCLPQKRKIIFNKQLVHVPPSCLEYVVCHELTHFIYPNHSPDFYRALAQRLPDWKERKKRLASFESLVFF